MLIAITELVSHALDLVDLPVEPAHDPLLELPEHPMPQSSSR